MYLKKSRSTVLKQFLLAISVFVAVVLPATAENASSTGLSAFTESSSESFLPPDQAFKLEIQPTENSHLKADFTIVPGYYLYKGRIKFAIKDTSQGEITAVDLPQADEKNDPNFGKTEVYHHDFSADISVKGQGKAVTVDATYQGCSEKGLCYAPQHKSFTLTLTEANAATVTPTLKQTEDPTTKALKSGNLWLVVTVFFIAGLLLALTPCVLPMLPILSGIIAGDKKVHHHATSRMHAFNLSLAYVLGMALSYTLAGIAAGLSGQLLSNALQNKWVLSATALIFVLLAFSMFGFYELRLPSRIEHRMVNTANRLKGGQFLGVFLMGAISALIVSPCVAAPLAGALLYISKTHDVVLGGVALFALSIGMGVPLLLIGASAGHVLPKTGAWMTAVRNFFGVLMLAVAIYIISPILPNSLTLLLWAALFIIPAMYLHALDNLPLDKVTGKYHPWMRFWKGVGIILLVLGITLLIGAASGAPSPLQPLAGLRGTASANSAPTLPFKQIKTSGELDNAIREANGKMVMLDFYADWCVSCKEMQQFTFSDIQVRDQLKEAVLLEADVTNNTADDQALLKRFGLFGPPGIIFFDRNGNELKSHQVVGYQDAAQFLATLKQIYSH
jgi:thioredoxin:protein disulfide reductase